MANYTFTNNQGVKYKMLMKRPHYSYHADGLCDPPDYRGPKIHIAPDLTPKREMAVMIEEMMHAFFWQLSEKDVRRFCGAVTRILHKEGWRQTVTTEPSKEFVGHVK
jgi:hypothetical protein|tara:strand:+ start:1184 stop:1504 length:321 start_codon:yes stop_codon:yes gene_type:complete